MSAWKRSHFRKWNKGVHAGAVVWLVVVSTFLLFAWPAGAQVQNGISEPQEGATVSGVVIIRGTAAHEAFLRYEVAFRRGDEWLVFAEGDRPVVDDTLAIWDTTVGQPQSPVFPDGVYTLRLRIVRQDYNYDEYFVRGLVVSNGGTPTPTPTATGTPVVGSEGTGTPLQATATPGSGLEIIRPTALPSLTPFPTPSLVAPPAGTGNDDSPRASGAAGRSPQGNDGGLLGRISSVSTDRFGRAFWMGVRLAFVGFLLLPFYLIMRWIVRRLWGIVTDRVLR